MVKRIRTANGIPQPMSILDMAAEVADPGIEDIAQRVFAEEEVAEHPRAFGVLVVDPQSAQVGYRVYGLFELKHLGEEVVEGDVVLLADLFHHSLLLLHEADYGLTVVLGYIFCFVLQFPIVGFLSPLVLPLLFPLVLCPLVLRNAFPLRNHPTPLIEGIVDNKLGEDGGGIEVDDGTVLLLLFDEAVDQTIVGVVVVAGEEVV